MEAAMAPPPTNRRHLIVIELDQGYTVSMHDLILGCESIPAVQHAVAQLLGPPLTASYAPSSNGTAHAIAPPPEPPPPAPPPEEEPFPDFTADEEVDDGVLADQRQNLGRLITALLADAIDIEELSDGLARYCPLLSTAEVNERLLRAQGIDPSRFPQGGLS